MKTRLLISYFALTFAGGVAMAQEKIELESIYVKGNKEFPQTLFVVPWKQVKAQGEDGQVLVLHSLFGDLFDPVYGDLDGGTAVERTAKPR